MNVWGLVLSLFLVFFILLLAQMMNTLFRLPKEDSRKIVHIGVSNWWLVAMFFFTSWQWAIIPPVIFVILNLVSWYFGTFDAMERKTRDVNNLGTVYFPISLLIMVLLTWTDSPILLDTQPYIGALAILALGYGDGLAAFVGTRVGRHKYKIFNSQKSLQGSLAMLIGSFVPMSLVLTFANHGAPVVTALVLAVLATIVEAISPRGLDNLTIPLVIFGAYYLFPYF